MKNPFFSFEVALYITVDIKFDTMFERNKAHLKHWRKHTAVIPKGFLRYYVLKLLSKGPMSGTDIIGEIEKRTSGCWKPSPGSIYPLLAGLQDHEIIKEVPAGESGVKLYTLTEKGKELLGKGKKIRGEIKAKLKSLMPFIVFELFWFDVQPSREIEAFRENERRLLTALFELMENLEAGFSEETLRMANAVLNEVAEKIEELNASCEKERKENG